MRTVKLRELSIAAAMLLLVYPAAAHAQTALRCIDAPLPIPSWCDTGASADDRADALLAAMTRPEKLGLMGGDDPFGVLTGDPATGWCHGIASLFLPDVYYNDGPSGLRLRPGGATGFPSPSALASTFDTAVADTFGDLLADESIKRRVDVVLAPMLNIVRYAPSGRAFESYGEDPHLVGRMAVAVVEAIQRPRLLPSGHTTQVIADPKHFAANNHEINRLTVSAEVDPRTLREIYLPAFESTVVEAGTGTVMLAYNRVNGTYMTENGPIVNGILKGEWGFQGIALTDWALAQHSTVESANNGNDLEMPYRFWYEPTLLGLAVDLGQISMATIDEHVRRILRTMFAFGVFDRPEHPLTGDISTHGAVARAIAAAGMTLLKNAPAAGDSAPILPLDDGAITSMALIGPEATSYIRGGGSSAVDPVDPVTPCEGITARAASAGITVTCNDGSDTAAAASLAASVDVAIVFGSIASTEFADRPCHALACSPADRDQDGLIAAVAAANPHTVVILETSSAVLMPWAGSVPAIIEAWYPGEQGGHAMADVLFGDAEPAGRLPVTFPAREEDTPFYLHPERYPGVAEMAQYSEGVFVGYRWYDENDLDVLFPFGHGLGYTTFAYSDFAIDSTGPEPVVRVTVTNTGNRRGSEVVQLYVGLPDVAVPQPPKALKGFHKVTLDPAQAATVSFTLSDRALSYWDAGTSSWQVAPGCYQVMVGASSRDVRGSGSFPLSVGNTCGICQMPTCRRPTLPGKSPLLVKNKPGESGDRFNWRWNKGAATTKAEFGNPIASTDYRLCLYDGTSTLVSEASAPADGFCDGKPCWRATSRGFKYRKRDVTGGGLQNSLQIVLKEGLAGKAKVGVKGKGGVNPVLPSLPLAQPVTVQLVNEDGMCWEARYGAPARSNDGLTFKDTSD